jgi:hypothetical protein
MVKTYHSKKKEDSSMAENKITFSFPIEESVTEQNRNKQEFLIRGTAITETTTKNGHKFIAEELSKSAMTLRNKPILKDHNNSVDSIVGKTTSNVNWDPGTRSIKFEAKIIDKNMQEMIKEGLINNVSVGAYVKEHEENDANEITLRGIEFVELSLVAVPADPNANFAKAICESLNISDNIQSEIIAEKPKEETIMAEEIAKVEEKPSEVIEAPKVDAQLEELNMLREFKAKIEKEKADLELRAKIEAEVRAKIESEKVVVKESPKVEAKPKAQIETEKTSEVKSDLKIMISEFGKGIAICPTKSFGKGGN